MLPRANRLTSAQFERAFSQSQSVRNPLVTVRIHRRHDEKPLVRAAFVVPKKQGKATERSGVRRRLREQFRIHPLRDTLEGCDLIFLANPQTHNATAEQLRVAIEDVLTRAAINLKSGAKRNRAPRVE